MHLKRKVRNIPNFPKKGIIFRDIAPLLEDKNAFSEAVNQLFKKYRRKKIDKVVGIDARGFILAGALAHRLKAGMVMVRKKGKLPCDTIEREYELEYGKAVIEMHKDSIAPGQKVVIIDDLIATGGTIDAIVKLIEELGGEVVKIVFLMELAGLEGRKKLENYDVAAVISYDGK